MKTTDSGQVMTSAEVAALFRVDVKTVARWTKQGKLACFRTAGGHRRFDRQVIEKLLNGTPET